MKGQYHKVVGFMETSKDNGNSAPKAKENDLADTKEEFNSVHADKTVGTDTHTTRKGENDNKLDNSGNLPAKRVQFLEDERNRGKNSRGRKDPGVGHPPRN